MSIIGISGKKNSGKNTVADIIQYLSYCKSNGNMSYFSYVLLDQPKYEFKLKLLLIKLKI
jgi:hypothetical protein